jgi:hypothetical protein
MACRVRAQSEQLVWCVGCRKPGVGEDRRRGRGDGSHFDDAIIEEGRRESYQGSEEGSDGIMANEAYALGGGSARRGGWCGCRGRQGRDATLRVRRCLEGPVVVQGVLLAPRGLGAGLR